MNNDDERDTAEEAYNRATMHDGPEPFELAQVQLTLIINATRTVDTGTDIPTDAPAEWVATDIAEALARIGITEVDVAARHVEYLDDEEDPTPAAQAAYVEQTEPPRELADALALDLIAEMLRDPEWAPGMLEDAAVWVTATGRTTVNYPDERDTWDRH